MSGSLTAIITIPIVVAIALFSWIFAVLWANRHPRWAHHEAQQAQPLQTEVRGGAFQAVEGGRQLMPIPERLPAGVPGPRPAVATETYHPGAAHAAAPSSREAARQSAPAGEAMAEEATPEETRERPGRRSPQ